ncbi:MAG: proliferating cell nuclear antigen (pcna) [Candidatus Odinarchaeota archaeon]
MSEAKSKKTTKTKKEGSFSITMENPKILKGIVETIAKIIDEANFTINSKEFKLRCMDPSRICLFDLIIKKENFDEFKCTRICEVGLNLDNFEKILKRSGSNDKIILEYQDSKRKLKIKMVREGEKTRTRTFSLSCIDLEVEEVPIDNLKKIEFPATFSVDPDFLIEALKDAEIYSEILYLKSIENVGLEFTSIGTIGEMEYQLGLDEFIEADLSETQTGGYSITFLKAIMKLSSITEQLEVSLKTDHPLKLLFKLLEGAELEYYIAPRVDENPEDDDFVEDDEFTDSMGTEDEIIEDELKQVENDDTEEE